MTRPHLAPLCLLGAGLCGSGCTGDAEKPVDSGPPVEVSDLAASVSPSIGSILVVGWTQDRAAPAHLEFSFDDGEWLASRTVERGAGGQTDLILGAPYGSAITWRLVVADGADTWTSPDTVTSNDELPSAVPVAEVVADDAARRDLDAGRYWFIGLGLDGWYTDPWWQLIFDSRDRVVWAWRTPTGRTSMHARVARDQRSLYLDRNSYWVNFDAGAASTVDQVYIDGTLIHTFETPGLHHPFTDLPDGSVAYGSQHSSRTETIRIVDAGGEMEEIWNCNRWIEAEDVPGYCASNTLNYDEATGRFLMSFYSLNAIIEVDRETGGVDRWFGEIPGAYAFDPPDSGFWWQHGGVYTEAGTLLTSTDRSASGEETVAREYAIDDTTRTLTEIWSFGIGEGLYGRKMGEAVRLPNGNTVHNYGAMARLREVTSDGEVVHDLVWDAGAIGRTMPIADLYTLAPPVEP